MEGNIPVRVKNSYNPKAPGTLITKDRDMAKVSILKICLIFILIEELKALTFQC